MKREKMYSLAIRRRENENDYFWNHKDYAFSECQINCKGRYWLADPFLFEKDNIVYVFYEAFDLIERKGKIAYSRLKDNGCFSAPKIILDEKYHLSFPNIFEYKGNIYIMPESCGDYRVKLFKAISFPNQWESADIILPDIFACDSIFITNKEKRYLLINEMYHNTPNGSYSSCWVKNYIYKLDDFRVTLEREKISEGDYGIRNAGKSFYINNKLYRIGQNCHNNQYGKGLILFETETIEPYKEKIVWSKDNEEFQFHINSKTKHKIIGVHTYNFSKHYEIIDFSQKRPLNLKVKLGRFMRPITRRIGKLYKLK